MAMATGAGGSAVGGRVFGALDWSVGIRRSTDTDFLLSYSDRTFGTYSLVDVSHTAEMVQSTFEAALMKLSSKYIEAGVHNKMVETGTTEPPPK
jgi:hypothetical protein